MAAACSHLANGMADGPSIYATNPNKNTINAGVRKERALLLLLLASFELFSLLVFGLLSSMHEAFASLASFIALPFAILASLHFQKFPFQVSFGVRVCQDFADNTC